MDSPAQIYGRIGAAKAFTSNVSDALKLDTQQNEATIAQLQEELKTASPEDKKKIQKKINRLKRRNKMKGLEQKAYKSVSDFLSNIIAYLDIQMAAVIEWIAGIIVGVLPALEISVKMLLLTNIKKMVSCAADPRIPEEWRTNGVILNEAQVDPRQILKTSPYSKWGKYLYFGQTKDENEFTDLDDSNKVVPVSELARAKDMNAFLWYAKTHALFVTSNVIPPTSMNTYFSNVPNGSTFYNTHVFQGKEPHRFIENTSFKHSYDSSTIFLCEKREFSEGNVYYTILPATDTWTGITWYKDRTNIMGNDDRKKKNYNKSKPLFNIEYLGTYDNASLYRDGNFRFRILPRPFSTAGGFIVDLENNLNTISQMADSDRIEEVFGTDLTASGITNYQFTGIQSPMPYYARFNENGDYDKKGRYSIDTRRYFVSQEENASGYIRYDIKESYSSSTVLARMFFVKKGKRFVITESNASDYNTKASYATISKVISECYFGNTVYEFNYDYVVSMKLFDAKSIATSIVDSLLNIPFNRRRKDDDDTLSDTNQIIIDSYVDKLIEKMIDNEEHEFSDCFYNFSNDDYEAMEQEVVDKVKNRTLITDNTDNSITEIYDIIGAYNADATLNERTETIKTAITKAVNACGYTDNTGQVSGNGIDGVSYATSMSESSELGTFIQKLVKLLTSAIVNAILTPKVLMLIQVNRMMMGTYAMPTNQDEAATFTDRYNYNTKDVLNGLSGVIKGVIREVIDTIQKELLRMILERLSEIMATYLKKLGMEYAMKWALLLRQLLECFKRNKHAGDRVGRSQYTEAIESILDQVDYADIDNLVDEVMPNTNPC